MSALRQLLEVSAPLAGPPLDLAVIPEALRVLTPGSAGFIAFERALLVVPPQVAFDLTREHCFTPFGVGADFCVFAFDLFGCMYAIRSDGKVVTVDAETGEMKGFADDLEAWATRILEKPGSTLGSELGRAWQQLHGQLAPLERLVPRRPFVLGGDYEVSNLVRCPLRRALALYGSLCEQLTGAADGTPVEVRGWWPADAQK